MFSIPTKFSDFFARFSKWFPYFAVFNGVCFVIVGMFFIYSGNKFTDNSEGAQLRVVTVEIKRNSDGVFYKPLFEAIGSDGKTIQYLSNMWVSPRPHNEGDIVEGRVNWSTGEIRSVSMIKSHVSLGKTFALIGGIFFLLGLVCFSRKRTRALPPKFSDFFPKNSKWFPYLAVFSGGVFVIVGMFFIYSGNKFTANSESAQLRVVTVEIRRDNDGVFYKPLFEAIGNDGKPIQYLSYMWVSPRPHNEGDIVEGRVNWSTGEIRSVSMIKSNTSFGKLFALIGSVFFLLGLAYFSRKRFRAFWGRSDLG